MFCIKKENSTLIDEQAGGVFSRSLRYTIGFKIRTHEHNCITIKSNRISSPKAKLFFFSSELPEILCIYAMYVTRSPYFIRMVHFSCILPSAVLL